MEKELKSSPEELEEEGHKSIMEKEAKRSKEIMEEERKEKELKKELIPYAVKEIEEKIKREGIDEGEINKILKSSALSKEEAILAWKQGLIDNELWGLKQEKEEIEKKFFSVEEKEKAISGWKQQLEEKYKKSEGVDKEK